MRRRRQSNTPEDSFDLFLDTITNTFGGVLLIALLIVLMIRENNDSLPEEKRTGPSARVVESEIDLLSIKDASLKRALETQNSLDAELKTQEIAGLAGELRAITTEESKLELTVADQAAELESIERRIRKEKDLQKERVTELARVRQDVLNETEKLKKEQASRERRMSLPKEKKTLKIEVPVIVKDDQLFFVNSNPDGFFRMHKEFMQESNVNADLRAYGKSMKAKAGGGITTSNVARLKKELGRYSATKSYFAFIVRTNSFDKFSRFRDTVVQAGFEYRLILTDDPVGASSNVDAKAQ